jgi:hypothetical protein
MFTTLRTLILAGAVGTGSLFAAGTASAHTAWNFSIGLAAPVYSPPVVVYQAPVVVQPQVLYTAPIYQPAPIVVTPPCVVTPYVAWRPEFRDWRFENGRFDRDHDGFRGHR